MLTALRHRIASTSLWIRPPLASAVVASAPAQPHARLLLRICNVQCYAEFSMIHFCIDFGCPTLTNPRACHCEWWHAGPPRLLATSARSTRRSASRPPILSRCIGGVVVSRCVVWHSEHRTYSAVTHGGVIAQCGKRLHGAVVQFGTVDGSITSLHAAGRRCDGDCCGRAADGCVTCCTRLPDRKKCAQLCIQADTVALPDWAGASGAGHSACRWSAPMTGARGSSCS